MQLQCHADPLMRLHERDVQASSVSLQSARSGLVFWYGAAIDNLKLGLGLQHCFGAGCETGTKLWQPKNTEIDCRQARITKGWSGRKHGDLY